MRRAAQVLTTPILSGRAAAARRSSILQLQVCGSQVRQKQTAPDLCISVLRVYRHQVTKPILAIAGLWRADAKAGDAFTMLTTSQGRAIAQFHGRQVIVLPVKVWASWLNLEKPEIKLLKPLPARSLTVRLARAGREPPERALLARQAITTDTFNSRGPCFTCDRRPKI